MKQTHIKLVGSLFISLVILSGFIYGFQTHSIPLMIGPKIYVILRYDDYGDYSNRYIEEQFLEILTKYHLNITFAVIPFSCNGTEISNNSVDFIKEYVANRTIEISLHGYCHAATYDGDNQSYPYSEFRNRPREVQFEEINQGKQTLEHLFSQNLSYFVPPTNTYDNNTLDVLKDLDFSGISGEFGINLANETEQFPDLRFFHAEFLIESSLFYLEKYYKTPIDGPILLCSYFHALDFRELGMMNKTSLTQFEQICKWLSNHDRIEVISFQKAADLGFNSSAHYFLR